MIPCVACGARTGLLDEPVEEGAPEAGGAGEASSTSDATLTNDAGDPRDASFESAVDANVAASLEGLRWELPCSSATLDPTVCSTPQTAVVSATMGGAPGTTYEVSLRFRGVVEISQYVGGTNDGAFWQTGGAPPAGSTINVYGLTISSPPQTYFLNRGVSHRVVVGIDYSERVLVTAGATVTLLADSRDALELRNLGPSGAPVVVPGVPPAPEPFDGQFIQMDVLEVRGR